MVWILGLTIIFMPMMRDLFTNEELRKKEWIPYLNLMMMYSFNPKLFSPFVNYVLNSKMPKKDRTAINSITFISSTLSSSILINIFGPLYAASFSNSYLLSFNPWNKYISFFALFVILILGSSFMVKINLK